MEAWSWEGEPEHRLGGEKSGQEAQSESSTPNPLATTAASFPPPSYCV